tara:strand:+ start:16474 stop:17214 length:741 start_codon:yes stop_codon:yes gene_type:complete
LRIIKLNATSSTNSFIKELARKSFLENYTIVVTNNQSSGRGQMDKLWESEPNKNLTFSIFTSLKKLKIKNQAYLNFAISLAIFDVLKSLGIPNLYIKWPNDIMSAKKKICGILIETTFYHQQIKNTVIGIGLNVNQEKFSSKFQNAASLKMIVKKKFDLDPIMNSIIEKIKYRISTIENGSFKIIHKQYHNVLYKKGIPTTFIDKKTNLFFMGIILGVTSIGNLQIQLEDDTIVEYGLKEVSIAKV